MEEMQLAEDDFSSMRKDEKLLTREAEELYNEVAAVLLIVSFSDKTRGEKVAFVKTQIEKLNTFNARAGERLESLYKKNVRIAHKQIGKPSKKITAKQIREIGNLKLQFKTDMSQKAFMMEQKAYKAILKSESEAIKEALGYKLVKDKVWTGRIKKRPFVNDVVFRGAKGKIIKPGTYAALSTGDNAWKAMQLGRTSTYLRYGFKYGIHRSIVDDKTTDICLSLDGKVRNLKRDPLPPLHPHCRSRIQVITNPNFRP